MAATKKKPAPKPKPVCHLVSDKPNDSGPDTNAAGGSAAASSVYDSSLDIVGGDVASDGKTITAVIRVAKLTTSDSMAPLGRQWQFTLRDGNTSLGFNIYDGPYGHVPDNAVFDTKNNEIRLSMKTSAFTAPLKLGTVLSDFNLTSQVAIENPTATQQSLGVVMLVPGGTEDYASGLPTVNYKIGTPSCVPLGK